MLPPFVPPAREVRILRYWWLGFVVLLLAGAIGVIRQSKAGSIQEAMQWHHQFYHNVESQLFAFVLLLVVSYTGRKAVWWLAVGLIVLKAVFLMCYYLTTDYTVLSTSYYNEFVYCCTVLDLKLVRIFFDDPICLVTMLGLYAYWLVLCRRVLQATA